MRKTSLIIKQIAFGFLIVILSVAPAYLISSFIKENAQISKGLFVAIFLLLIYLFLFIAGLMFRRVFIYFRNEGAKGIQKNQLDSADKLISAEKKKEEWSKYKDEM